MAMFNFDLSPKAQLEAELLKIRKQKEEVQLETYRRTQNKMAEQEGKARAIADGMTQTFRDMESAQRDYDSVQKQWFEARSKGVLSPEMNDMYRNAFSNSSSNLELQKSKYRVLTMEKGHMDGSLDKPIADSVKPMLGNIFDPKKDPYDQIQEERSKKKVDLSTGEESITTQKGSVSQFRNLDAATQGSAAEEDYIAPSTATSLLGFTPRGFDADPEAVTPEISYRPVKDQGSVSSERDVAGATEVDPMSALPNTNPIASQQTNPIASAPEVGGIVRVRNKATGETGTMPRKNWISGKYNSLYEEIP